MSSLGRKRDESKEKLPTHCAELPIQISSLGKKKPPSIVPQDKLHVQQNTTSARVRSLSFFASNFFPSLLKYLFLGSFLTVNNPLRSNMTSHLLPKNMGVLPNAAELAGCLVTSYANPSFKKEAVHLGCVLGVCSLWESSVWQYDGMAAQSPHFPDPSIFIFFLWALLFVFGDPFQRALPL